MKGDAARTSAPEHTLTSCGVRTHHTTTAATLAPPKFQILQPPQAFRALSGNRFGSFKRAFAEERWLILRVVQISQNSQEPSHQSVILLTSQGRQWSDLSLKLHWRRTTGSEGAASRSRQLLTSALSGQVPLLCREQVVLLSEPTQFLQPDAHQERYLLRF